MRLPLFTIGMSGGDFVVEGIAGDNDLLPLDDTTGKLVKSVSGRRDGREEEAVYRAEQQIIGFLKEAQAGVPVKDDLIFAKSLCLHGPLRGKRTLLLSGTKRGCQVGAGKRHQYLNPA
jgi:hypothetical protein